MTGDEATHEADHALDADIIELPEVHVHGLPLNKDQQLGPVPKSTPWPAVPSSLDGKPLDDWMKARLLVSKDAKVTVVVLEPAKHRELTVAGMIAVEQVDLRPSTAMAMIRSMENSPCVFTSARSSFEHPPRSKSNLLNVGAPLLEPFPNQKDRVVSILNDRRRFRQCGAIPARSAARIEAGLSVSTWLYALSRTPCAIVSSCLISLRPDSMRRPT